MELKHLLPPNIYEAIDRAGIYTTKQIMILSVWDIKKSTNLSTGDIALLKNIVTDYECPVITTGNHLKCNHKTVCRLTTGCSHIDNLLKGGLVRGMITEVFGESGCGKTQLALQITLNNWANGSVYICTENSFPTKRFEEMKRYLPNFGPKIDYGQNIFVEHITDEAKDLLSCIRVRLPKLLAKNKLSLIVIDSVAAPFRCHSINYIKRAEDLREMTILMTKLAQEYDLAILCLNQVTASFEESDNVLPSLGLAWSNMVITRLIVKKTLKIADANCLAKVNCQQLNFKHDIYLRELSVVFAPHLPQMIIKFIITPSGIQSILD